MSRGTASLPEIVRDFYKVAVGHWGVAPSEFWSMTPREWWWVHEFKQGLVRAQRGGMTQDELDELDAFAKEHGKKYVN